MKYSKSNQGYYYKEYANGTKKRISIQEFQNKNKFDHLEGGMYKNIHKDNYEKQLEEFEQKLKKYEKTWKMYRKTSKKCGKSK